MAAVVRKDRRSATWKSGNALSIRPAALIACSSNRRRRTLIDADAAATTATASDASSWAYLPEGVVDNIGWRVLAGDLLDYIRFRAVCPHWRSSTASPRGRGVVDPRFHPRRWMMLPEGHGLYPGHGKLRGYVRFFNLSTGTFVRVGLPLFRDHCALTSTDGIMLLQRDHDTAIRLLNPFTGDITELPRLDSLGSPVPLEERQLQTLRAVVAAAISVSADETVSVTMSLHLSQGFIFATSRDQKWRMSSFGLSLSYTPLPFQGKIYVVDDSQSSDGFEVLQIGPPQQDEMDPDFSYLPPPEFVAKCPVKPSNARICMIYFLAECNSEILLITMHVLDHDHQFSVYRLADLILERIVPVTDLGGNSIFLGPFSSRMLSVSAKAFPTIMADSIVFLDNNKHYLAQYQLSTRTLSPTSDGHLLGNIALPSPRSIFYYIFTCCFREKWLEQRAFDV
ncbi:hypothetical protein ACP70R_017780 [Stipagrostis hirtigluma subsp. patula]